MSSLLFLAIDDSTAGFAGAGIVVLLIGVVGLIIAIAWIVFPFIVVSKCNEMIKLLTRIESLSKSAILQHPDEENSRTGNKTGKELLSGVAGIREAGNEISKALQWMIDNWKVGAT